MPTVGEVEVIVSVDASRVTSGIKQAVAATQGGAKAMGDAFKGADAASEGLGKRFATLATEISTGSSGTAASIRSEVGGAMKETGADAGKMGDAAKRAFKDTADSADGAARKLVSTSGALRQVASSARTIGVGLSAALTLPLVAAAKTGLAAATEFESSMTLFRSAANASASDMAKVGDEARKLAADEKLPANTAGEVAAAMVNLSQKGLGVVGSMQSVRSVLILASAAQVTNAEAAEITVRALDAFKLSASDAGKVADLLTASAHGSGATIKEMSTAFDAAGATFHNAGFGMADLATALVELRKAGVPTEASGTALKMMVQNLAHESKAASAEMKVLGVNVFDAQGKMIPFRDIIDKLHVATADFTDKQKDMALATVFGARSLRAANVIVGEGVTAFDRLRESTTRQGAAANAVAENNKTFGESLRKAQDAGTDMLQGFIAPVLPKLTDLAQSVAGVERSMSGWSPMAKDVTRDLGATLAVVGPGVLVVGGFARAIGSVIGLKDTFKAAQAAKQAALTATTTASTVATTATEGLTTATTGNDIAARLAATSLGTEAAASTAAGDAATVAAGQFAGEAGALDGVAASASVAAINLKSVNTWIGIAGAAYAGLKLGGLISKASDEDAQGQGYADNGDRLNKKFGFDGTIGGFGHLFYGLATGNEDRSAQRSDDAAGQAAPGFYNRWNKGQGARSAQSVMSWAQSTFNGGDGPSAADSAESAAARARQDTADRLAAMGKPKRGGDGGREGNSGADKAAEKAAREEAAAIKALQDQYYEAAKAVALYGNDKASASMMYDVAHGKIKAENDALAQTVVGQLKAKESLDAWVEAKKAAKDRADEWAAATLDHTKAMAVSDDSLSEKDKQSMTTFGKRFDQLTDVHNQQKVMWALDEAHAAKAKENRDAGEAWAKDTINNLKQELAAKTQITNVDRTLAALESQKQQGHSVSWVGTVQAVGAAANLDKSDAADKDKKNAQDIAAAWAEVFANVTKAKAAMVEGAAKRYDDTMASLNARLLESGSQSEKVKAQTIKLAESFGVGATAAERIKDGMTRANAVMAEMLKVDKIEAFRVQIKGMADEIGGYFANKATDMLTHFKFSFKGIVSGFDQMIGDMAKKALAAQIQSLVSRFVGGVFSNAFGSGGDGGEVQGHATGGPVLANEAIMVGENGPEMFVPAGNGSIATAAQTRKAGGVGGATVHVTMNVNANDVGSFHQSKGQLAADLGREIRKHLGIGPVRGVRGRRRDPRAIAAPFRAAFRFWVPYKTNDDDRRPGPHPSSKRVDGRRGPDDRGRRRPDREPCDSGGDAGMVRPDRREGR